MIIRDIRASYYDSSFDFSMMQIQGDHIQRRFGLLWIGMLVYVGGLLGAYSMDLFFMLFNLFIVNDYLSQMTLYYI